MTATDLLQQVLDAARWAPSGDNTQPWRFEQLSDRAVRVHGQDTRRHCVYDLDSVPTLLSLGALVETMAIAASERGCALHWQWCDRPAEDRPTLDVRLEPDERITPSPLAAQVPQRRVQRRAMSTRALTPEILRSLEASVGPGYQLAWHAGWTGRWTMGRLLFANAKLRLTLPEAHPTHRDVIEWGARTSIDRLPDQSLGADPLTLRLMSWALQDWRRVDFMNRWMAGTWLPRLQMDLLPALACAAHVGIVADHEASSDTDHLNAGRMVQRLWLTMSGLGLQHQPEVTPLVFARYVEAGRRFTTEPDCNRQAVSLHKQVQATLGPQWRRWVWLGRVGHGPAATSRSLRLPLDRLMH